MDANSPQLTREQLEMLRLLSLGHRVTGVARLMAYSHESVYRNLVAARTQLNVASNIAAVVLAIQLELLPWPTREEMLAAWK